jgi:hypothetical protein
MRHAIVLDWRGFGWFLGLTEFLLLRLGRRKAYPRA